MENDSAEARQRNGAARPKSAVGSGARGRGGRGGIRGGRGRGRGRGRGGGRRGGRGGDRVVRGWLDEGGNSDDEEDGYFAINGGETEEKLMTDSDFERLEAEIDTAVELAELETFAGTMVIDADDVALMREKLATASTNGSTPKNKNKKKNKKAENKAEKVEEKADEESKPAPPTKKNKKGKKKKPTRVSVVVTDSQELEVVELQNEKGVTSSGQSVEIRSAKTTKTKPKKSKAQKNPPNEELYHTAEVPQSVVSAEAELSSVSVKRTKKTRVPLIESDDVPPTTATVETDKPQKHATNKKGKHAKKNQTETPHVAAGGVDAAPAKNTKKKGGPQSKTAQSATVQPNDGKPHQNVAAAVAARPSFYEGYRDRAAVLAALERGDLYQGKLRINPQYRLRAFVTVAGISVDVLVDGVRDRNRGMDGDLVAIQLLDEDKWKPLMKKGEEDRDKKPTNKMNVETYGSVPSSETAKVAARSSAALHALWRPTLEASKCFLPPSSSFLPSSSPSASSPVASAHAVTERSQLLKRRPTAKVVSILAAGNAEGFVGALEPKTKPANANAPLLPQDDYAYFNAQDERLPRRIRIPRLQLPDEFVAHPLTYSQQMMCFCRITNWSESHESPVGEFVKTLGEYSGIESGISAILMKHGLLQHTNDFRAEILDELDTKYGAGGEKWSIPDDEAAQRRDFRKYQIFSIDPYNARDLDDALHIRALDTDATQFEVGVHIADVTHFIAKSSFLDVEAQQRATSVYLANRVLPMLPRILCERLCSLQPQVDRLAFSVVWQMNKDGSLVDGCVPWFGKSIIRSCCKLDYGTAQRMLDGKVTKDKLDEWEPERRPVQGDNAQITPETVIQAVKYLWLVAKNRRETRFDTGAVTLQNVKLTFTLDAMGNPTSFGTYQLKNSNRLVEEYMLLANYLVAQKLLQAHGPLAFLRRHPEPNAQALETTVAVLGENAIHVDGSSPKKLSESLDTVRDSHGEYEYGVVQNMITKPMKPAEYLVAGTAGFEDAWRHYALNIPYYTHFTSPIRRYADVVVHRLLQESIVEADAVAARLAAATRGDELHDEDEQPSGELTKLMQELQSVAQNCNEKKMTSKNAEKDCDQVFLCAYIKHHGAVDVTGVVVSTGQRSFTVYISELGLEQRIEVKPMGSVRFSWQEKTSTLSLVVGKTKRPQKEKATQEKEDTEESKAAEGKKTTGQPGAALERVDLKFLTKLRMRMATTDRMPLALQFDVVGPWKP